MGDEELDIFRRGRLNKPKSEDILRFSSSIRSDERIFKADLMVDYAHVIMLVEQGIIRPEHGAAILKSLKNVERLNYWELVKGNFEDVHMAIETWLIRKLGEDVGGRMHTGRSRNDEVATCLRLSLRWELQEIMSRLLEFMETILRRAEEHIGTVMPGYTHLQRAQPVTLAHHLLAYFDMLKRDFERLVDAYRRVNLSPLGAAALASTSFPLNRERTADLLGFYGLVENSIDAVSSRDFILETVSMLSIMCSTITRFAEELILWCSQEFGFVELPDELAATSSIMPQKKNPDVIELIRAKSSGVFGDLVSLLSIIKGLPLAYNRDLQEMNSRLWKVTDTVKDVLTAFRTVIERIKFKPERMRKALADDFSTATDLADLLVRLRGLPFRTAHTLVGALVSETIRRGLRPHEITASLLNEISRKILGRPVSIPDEELREALNPMNAVKARGVKGGPSPDEVKLAVEERKKRLGSLKAELAKIVEFEERAQENLRNAIGVLIKEGDRL